MRCRPRLLEMTSRSPQGICCTAWRRRWQTVQLGTLRSPRRLLCRCSRPFRGTRPRRRCMRPLTGCRALKSRCRRDTACRRLRQPPSRCRQRRPCTWPRPAWRYSPQRMAHTMLHPRWRRPSLRCTRCRRSSPLRRSCPAGRSSRLLPRRTSIRQRCKACSRQRRWLTPHSPPHMWYTTRWMCCPHPRSWRPAGSSCRPRRPRRRSCLRDTAAPRRGCPRGTASPRAGWRRRPSTSAAQRQLHAARRIAPARGRQSLGG